MAFAIFPTGISLAGTYGIYTAFELLSSMFVIKFVRETKGIELEDIDKA